MKLHFEPELDYQQQAIEAVCDIFKGQDICRSSFTVTASTGSQQSLAFAQTETGVGNELKLLDDELKQNLTEVQLRNGLAPARELRSGDFTVEMETGTGKTYVYLRTIFELNKRFGFTKFVVVVPSVAIKEGVYKTLQITEEHFKGLYDGVAYDYFVYDGSKPGEVRGFATSNTIQIMVMTIGAIRLFVPDEEVATRQRTGRKKPVVNVMYTPNEKTGGEKPIQLIQETRPVVIVDEPQSVDRDPTGRGRAALANLRPLCTLRYSATHVDVQHKEQMVYRLDAVDAYERELVKQIAVAAVQVESAHGRPYVKLLAVQGQGGARAQVELDIQTPAGVKRKAMWLYDGADLEQETGRSIYKDFQLGEIDVRRRTVQLWPPGEERVLGLNEAHGDVNPLDVKRLMIRRTIQEHLDKELRLRPQGVKVLSLFFLDHVANYRQYREDGTREPGVYARIFEEEYRKQIRQPKYRTLFGEADLTADPAEVHDGYFSVDKKGAYSDTAEGNQTDRENAERAYNLIMRDKEKLLSFDTKLRFLFSHSALREGWDNPNVFQICTLRDIGGELERRQTIGRGLRLCVNQQGERLRGFAVNRLTVIGTEGYQDFAKHLQQEIERETGLTFGVVKPEQFATIPVAGPDGQPTALGQASSEKIVRFLHQAGYIDTHGKVQDALRTALKKRTFKLPDELAHVQEPVQQLLRKLAGRLEVKDADEKDEVIATRRAVLESAEFRALWDRIKGRTTYRVAFDPEQLAHDCVQAINTMPTITRARAIIRTADLEIGKGGVQAQNARTSAPVSLNERLEDLPDLLTELQNRTQLTRRSLVHILTDAANKRLDDFSQNPPEFIDLAAAAINATKRRAVLDGIRYQRVGDGHYYAQELFEEHELRAYLRNTLDATKSVHKKVVFDSAGIEQNFARELEQNEAVKVYAKLPSWFTIPTPLGSYNPDWAVLLDCAEGERLYFVAETKGTLDAAGLRGAEQGKIKCGEAHFAALAEGQENPARYKVVTELDPLLRECPASEL